MGEESTFIKACYRQPVNHIPVWYMRQAGRYDPDYRKIKEKYTLLEICRQPELAAEVTMMPVRKLSVDAAILYSDIMNPAASMGIDFDIVPGVGPVIDKPIRSKQDVERLKPIDVEKDLNHVLKTIRIVQDEVQVPLIGFAGAPFTLASYLIEGRPSRNYIRTKQLMYTEPDIWRQLMDKLGQMACTYLKAQIKAGAQAIQLFDSWVGSLSPKDFSRYVLPTITQIFDELAAIDNVPSIYFPGVSSGELLPLLRNIKADVISIDWRVPLAEARKRTDHRFAIQGNLDPLTLLAPWDTLKKYAQELLDVGMQENGYIFNLGHGLFPEAPLDQLRRLTAFVHEYSKQGGNQK